MIIFDTVIRVPNSKKTIARKRGYFKRGVWWWRRPAFFFTERLKKNPQKIIK